MIKLSATFTLVLLVVTAKQPDNTLQQYTTSFLQVTDNKGCDQWNMETIDEEKISIHFPRLALKIRYDGTSTKKPQIVFGNDVNGARELLLPVKDSPTMVGGSLSLIEDTSFGDDKAFFEDASYSQEHILTLRFPNLTHMEVEVDQNDKQNSITLKLKSASVYSFTFLEFRDIVNSDTTSCYKISLPIDLEGYVNLKEEAGTTIKKDAADYTSKLLDLDLETSVEQTESPLVMTLGSGTTRYGVKKIVLYAKTTDGSIADWKVTVKDSSTSKADSQANDLNQYVPCNAAKDTSPSGSKDSYEFVCDKNLAVTHIKIQYNGSSTSELAEVVVAGKNWEAFPCYKGYYNDDSSSKGLHSDTAGKDCKKCQHSFYQDTFDIKNIITSGKCTECDSDQETKLIYYTANTGSENATDCKSCSVPKVRNENKNGCKDCEAGYQYKATGTDSACNVGTKYTDNRNSSISTWLTDPTKCTAVICEECPKGEYSNDSSKPCQLCPNGMFSSTTGKSSCDKCPEGKEPTSNKTACIPCDEGKYKGADNTTCQTCPEGHFSSAKEQSSCQKCTEGKQPNTPKTACEECGLGKYKSQLNLTCQGCPDGHFANTTTASTCTPCSAGTIPNSGKSDCVLCGTKEYQDQAEQTTCKTCTDGTQPTADRKQCTACLTGSAGSGGECVQCLAGKYQNVTGQTTCEACAEGTYSSTGAATCSQCPKGQYQSSAGKDSCKKCPVTTYSDSEGSISCTPCPMNKYGDKDGLEECILCPNNMYAESGKDVCSPCKGSTPDQIKDEMATMNSALKEKCLSDLGEGCYTMTIEDERYGSYTTSWIKVDEKLYKHCNYDMEIPRPQVEFHCVRSPDNTTFVRSNFSQCVKSAKTDKIEDISNKNMSNEEKSRELLNELSEENTTSIADVNASADLILKIVEDEAVKTTEVKENITQNLVDSVSNLNEATIYSSNSVSSSSTQKAVESMRELASKTEIKNTPVGSNNVAVMRVTKKVKDGEKLAPNRDTGALSFVVPNGDIRKGLKEINCTDKVSADTVLLIETTTGASPSAMDMNIVLFAKTTLYVDEAMSGQHIDDEGSKHANNKSFVKSEIFEKVWEDKKKDPSVVLVNSLIAEITVNSSEFKEGSELRFCLKTKNDLGGTGNNFDTDQTSGRRVEVKSQCAKYDKIASKWKKSCQTFSNQNSEEQKVCCVCNHNTSFAVLMSAFEVDRDYAKVQSLITKILLTTSTIGLILTLIFLLPSKALRTTRSSKINICFTFALLIASLVFLIQDLLIKPNNTGVIKLRSVGCAVYAMIQHYLWLVVFMWMGIEGFLMYLSLVQVFGSHISKYMIKFNLLAWGVPIVFPLIGYFAFTKKHVISSIEITEHNYLSDKMCFIKAESISFYVLFFLPLCLVIAANIVFFILVVRVIKSSKGSESVTDQELILRQLKAAVGVMILLGTGWFFGVFMTIPHPDMQAFTQYFFIIINSTQGIFVFIFYIILNDQVKAHWLVKVGMKEKEGTSSSAAKSTTFNTKNTAVSTRNDNIYENPTAAAPTADEDHTYASAEYANANDKGSARCEFPAKSDDNANI